MVDASQENGSGRSSRLVVISGISGSGKTTAIRALEDIGFFCVDNLPLVLLPGLLQVIEGDRGHLQQVALVVDAREGHFLDSFSQQMAAARDHGLEPELLFLDCDDRELVRRYGETRRRHPLFPQGPVSEGLRQERQLLKPIVEMADLVLDTTSLDPHQLRRIIQQRYLGGPMVEQLPLWLISFGFKFGPPVQAHLVFDARFLRNPHFVPELRSLDGRDRRVAEYVLNDARCRKFLDAIIDFVQQFRADYLTEGKNHLALAVGCTGGRHRSVAIIEELARVLAAQGPVTVYHRELEVQE